ncbi:MAG: hypothetical protein H6936_08450 [Burkholderiales bacterium]|nr:hypothetical protein [Nitrosomonas sp.]MCP5274861.1 hypothetical protein [Burkholderiales bacterium]
MSGYNSEIQALKYLLYDFDQPIAVQLQETYLHEISFDKNTLPHLDIVICRIFEHFIGYGFNKALIDEISDGMGCDVVDAFLSHVGHDHRYKLMSILADEALYRDEHRWNMMVANPFVLRCAQHMLNDYYEWWVINYDQTDELEPRPLSVERTYDSPPVDRYKYFLSIFPAVSFSLSHTLSCYFNNKTDVVKRIAVNTPIAVS